MSITIVNLSKKYKRRLILDRITFRFKNNNHYCIKGENGIGKSTLFKAILNQVKYDGYIEVEGNIAYQPEESIFPPYMSVLCFIKTLSTITYKNECIDEEIEEMLDMFDIKEYINAQLGSLSKGQRQKVNIIQAILTKSDVLMLDEPLNALDTLSRCKLINYLKNDERLIIVISHLTEEFKDNGFQIVELKENGFKYLPSFY